MAETLAQYQERTKATYGPSNLRSWQSSGPSPNQIYESFLKQLREYKMFTVVDETEAKEIEASARTRGATDAFLTNLVNFYNEWTQDESNENKPFYIYLNKESTDPFAGKKTDSLYTSMIDALKRKNLKEEWKVLKHKLGDPEVSYLVIRHL